MIPYGPRTYAMRQMCSGKPPWPGPQACADIRRRLHRRWLAQTPMAGEAAGDLLDGKPRKSARPIAIQLTG
jgi:hypothetical protein